MFWGVRMSPERYVNQADTFLSLKKSVKHQNLHRPASYELAAIGLNKRPYLGGPATIHTYHFEPLI